MSQKLARKSLWALQPTLRHHGGSRKDRVLKIEQG